LLQFYITVIQKTFPKVPNSSFETEITLSSPN